MISLNTMPNQVYLLLHMHGASIRVHKHMCVLVSILTIYGWNLATIPTWFLCVCVHDWLHVNVQSQFCWSMLICLTLMPSQHQYVVPTSSRASGNDSICVHITWSSHMSYYAGIYSLVWLNPILYLRMHIRTVRSSFGLVHANWLIWTYNQSLFRFLSHLIYECKPIFFIHVWIISSNRESKAVATHSHP